MSTPLCLTVRFAFFTFFPFRIEFGRSEIDVVRLPDQRRKAHIDGRTRLRVDATAFVVFARQTETIEDLYLVTILHVNAAVASALPPTQRFEGENEFAMQCVISELLFGFAAGGQQRAVLHVSARPFVGVGTIKKHGRARWRFNPNGGASPDGFFSSCTARPSPS